MLVLAHELQSILNSGGSPITFMNFFINVDRTMLRQLSMITKGEESITVTSLQVMKQDCMYYSYLAALELIHPIRNSSPCLQFLL